MLLAVVAVTLLGLLAYQFFIDPIREHEGAVLIATIALAMYLSRGHPVDFHRRLPEHGFLDSRVLQPWGESRSFINSC